MGKKKSHSTATRNSVRTLPRTMPHTAVAREASSQPNEIDERIRHEAKQKKEDIAWQKLAKYDLVRMKEMFIALQDELDRQQENFFKILDQKHNAIREKEKAYRALHLIQDELESATPTEQILQLRDIAWRSPEQNFEEKLRILKRLVLLCQLRSVDPKKKTNPRNL